MKAKDIINQKFEFLELGLTFKILEAQIYQIEDVSKKYEWILHIRPERLVVVSYRGTLLPNIIFEECVVYLKKVEIDGKIFKGPKAISNILGIKKDAREVYIIKAL